MRFAQLFLISVFAIHNGLAQNTNGNLQGIIVSNQGSPLEDVVVQLNPSNQVVFTDEKGVFRFANLAPGEYQLSATLLGYQSLVRVATVAPGKNERIRLQLHETDNQLEEVVVTGESETARIEKKGFSVEAIETQKIKTQSLELNKVLDRTPGVRVRRTGGMGSDFNYSLDGMFRSCYPIFY